MCGIIGYAGDHNELLTKRLARAMSILSPRGPDDSGTETIYCGQTEITFGHTRLAIIDRSQLGRQPMVDPASGNLLSYNGEIYNFRELRQELRSLGYSFQSNSDTEVVLAAYHYWGAQCLQRFRGMFAFAIYDRKKNLLFLARDRLGIKPLTYQYANNGKFAFSSDLRALGKLALDELRIDPVAIDEYFAYGFFSDDLSPLRNCYQLPPGCYAEYKIDEDKVSIEKYWDILDHASTQENVSLDEAITSTECVLMDAVEKHLVSDVPVGSYLSGGIDSSVVTAFAHKLMGSLETYSIGFSVPEWDEAPYAKKISDYLGTKHHEYYITPQNIEDSLVDVACQFDIPFADTSAIPSALLARETRKSVTVVLSGDGGDEVHYGYRRYKRAIQLMHIQEVNLVKSILHSVLMKLPGHRSKRWGWLLEGDNFAEAYSRMLVDLDSGLVDREGVFVASEIAKHLGSHPTSCPENVTSLVDLRCYLPGDNLVKVDRTSMANSLEVRVPLLDHQFVEHSLGLPFETKFHNGVQKNILKEILARHVPRELWNRKKTGFGIPLGLWMRNELRDWISGELAIDWSWTEGKVHARAIERLLKDHMEGKDNTRVLWSLFTLKHWAGQVGLHRTA